MVAVVDTSALARLFLEDDGHEATRAWFVDAIDRGLGLHAPELAAYELGRVIEREAPELSIEDRDVLLQLLLEPVRLAAPAAVATFDLAATHGLTFYDAAFIALADELGATLVTSDRKMADAARAEGVPVEAFP